MGRGSETASRRLRFALARGVLIHSEDQRGHALLPEEIVSLIAFILFGLIIGLIARAIMPGRQSMGLLATALVGMAGSFLGGVIGNLISGGPLFTLQKSGIIGSLLGALAVLFIIGFVGRRRQAVT